MIGIAPGTVNTRRHARHRLPRPPSWWERPETRIFDLAVVLALFVLPFVVGGRHPAGLAVLSVAAAVACLAWLLRMVRADDPRWTAGLGEVFLAAGLLIGGVQLLAMPTHVIDAVSPQLHRLLPAYSGGSWSLGTWQTLSLTPGDTAVGISILVAQGILALVVCQFVRSVEAIERVLVIVVAAAAMLALHGVIQFVGHEGRNFDVATVSFHEEGGIVKAMFRNRNDFAGFLAIAAGPAVWLAFRGREPAVPRGRSRSTGTRHRRPPRSAAPADGGRIAIGLGALAIISFAVFASLARGGSIALAAAITLACLMLLRSGHLRPRMGLAILATAAVVGVALEIHGMERFTDRMETIFDDSQQEQTFGRREVWEAACRTIRAYPVCGTGVGSHHDMSPITMPPTGDTHFVHAENSYLNLAVEAGLPGLAVAVLAMVTALAAAAVAFHKGSPRERPVAAALMAGLVAGAINGIGHFNWYVPAITTLLMVLGTCALRMAARHVAWIPSWRIPVARSMATVMASAAVVLLGVITSRHITAAMVEPKWDEAVAWARTLTRERRSALRKEAPVFIAAVKWTEQPKQPEPALMQGVNEVVEQRAGMLRALDERVTLLEDVVTERTDHPQAWAALATALCERFCLARLIAGESITLLDIRKVATSGGFSGEKAFQDWLERVAGDGLDDLRRANEAAKRAVRLAPCQGDAWCVLANLAFLDHLDAELPRKCMEQAIVVRPHDETVLFEAAQQAQLDGDENLAATRWRESFAASSGRRDAILSLLLPTTSAVEAMAMFEPDLGGLRAIDAAWSGQSTPEEMRPVRERRLAAVIAAAEEAAAPAQASQRCRLLQEAASLHRTLGRDEQAAEALAAALIADPSNYAARIAGFDLAIALGDPGTAKEHLDWLLLRRPNAKPLQDRVTRLKQLRVRLASATGSSGIDLNASAAPAGARR